MNANLLNIVKQIAAQYGEGILGDPPAPESVFCRPCQRRAQALRIAFGRCIETGAYNALKTAQDAAERAERKAAVARRVRDEHGLDMALCGDALDILEAALFADRKEPPRCTSCGRELQESWKACPFCGMVAGTKQPEVPAQAQAENQHQHFAVEGNVVVSAQSARYSDSNSQSPVKKGVKIACNYDGVLIQVINSWTKATLYIDGLLVDQYYSGFNAVLGKTLILKAVNYPFKSGTKTIQVFCKSGLVSVKFMLCIDGVYINGDRI